jgi:hypothetical protein
MLAARAKLIFRANNLAAAVAGLAFAAFVCATGIPTLRHDWSWPIDRAAVPFFFSAAVNGWLSAGFGFANAHPTTYLLALPIGLVMWVFGPLTALALFAFIIGVLCMRAVAAMAERWRCALPAAIGLGLFALFNPWVYNQVVAGHLVMVLAYAAFIGLLAEMLRGTDASWVRLALWLALIAAQLQLFILAMLALVVFASATKKWQPVVVGALIALPWVIGVVADRSALLGIPYTVTWQANQSIDPLALLSLGGYFAGYSDRLGLTAQIAVWSTFAIALTGLILAARRSRPAIWAGVAAVALYVAILGLRGPAAAPYEWLVRDVPETGVFRELYDLAGILAALLVLLACAAAAAWRPIGYAALAAGALLIVTWIVAPPSDLWIAAQSYPHPDVRSRAFTRVAFLPAFQPVGLRAGGGAGADPDIYEHPGNIGVLNEYFPTYPVDMALAQYEQSRDPAALRALGVGTIIARPWLVSRSNGGIGLAAPSLIPSQSVAPTGPPVAYLNDATPLISNCEAPRVVLLPGELGACNIFFGDTKEYGPVRPLETLNDSLDPRTDWIDARLAFGEDPSVAQGIGGTLTQSHLPYPVDPGASVLVYVHGILTDSAGRILTVRRGGFRWLTLPSDAKAVQCVGLCVLVAQTRALPNLPARAAPTLSWACDFRKLAPWLYVVRSGARPARLLRLNERYDSGWIAIDGWRVLPHLRVDMAANGWLYRDQSSTTIVLLQATSLLQLVAEILGVLCVAWLLAAATRYRPADMTASDARSTPGSTWTRSV